jgi:hypothetical protein
MCNFDFKSKKMFRKGIGYRLLILKEKRDEGSHLHPKNLLNLFNQHHISIHSK